jgi:hypothetical protein
MKNLILLLLLFTLNSVYAAHYHLFSTQGKESTPNSNYNKIIDDLGIGDTIEFSNHKTIRLGQRLDTKAADSDKGARTAIFEIKDAPEYVIRIPLIIEERDGISETINGYKDLEYLNKNIVKLIDGSNNEYVIVSKIPKKHYTFLDLIMKKSISEVTRIKMLSSLMDFSRLTSRFSELGDFHTTQFIYDIEQNQWILFDWSHHHQTFIEDGKVVRKKTIWDFVYLMYSDNEFTDENMRRLMPKFTDNQREQIRVILDMLADVAEKERALTIAKLEINKEHIISCKGLIKSFFKRFSY